MTDNILRKNIDMHKDGALKMALEALTLWNDMYPNTTACAIRNPAITAIKEALAYSDQTKTPMNDRMGELARQAGQGRIFHIPPEFIKKFTELTILEICSMMEKAQSDCEVSLEPNLVYISQLQYWIDKFKFNFGINDERED